MATLSFQVHEGKENETPLHRAIDNKGLKGRSLQPQQHSKNNKLTQPTPRKALGSVSNQEVHPFSQGVKKNGFGFSKGPVESLFKSKKAVCDENLPTSQSLKKKQKRSPDIHTELKPPSLKPICKTKTPQKRQKPAVEPIPKVHDDVEYDSDTIFPRSDRLSCYVDKILTWRPPCLFGTLPDSDSCMSDEDVSISLEDIPVDLEAYHLEGELPNDFSELLIDLPSNSPINLKDLPAIHNSLSSENLEGQSVDNSLHLGTLDLNMSDINNSDLGLGSSTQDSILK